MRIDEKRNLVLPIAAEKVTKKITQKIDGKDVTKDVTEDVVRVYAFHSPVSREVFEANYRVLAATKSALASKGHHYLMSSGPRIAALTLKDEGRKDAAERGSFDKDGNIVDEETAAFFLELKRLTMVLCPGANGWEMLPVDTAISSGKIDSEDWEEAASSIIFFCCHYAMARKADRETTARATASVVGASITSSSITEFLASLPTSTPAEPTRPAASSIPS
jgi:hypothetical protein